METWWFTEAISCFGSRTESTIQCRRCPPSFVESDWLLQGTRFAVLHGDGPKPSLTVYNMKVRALGVQPCPPLGWLRAA